MLIKFKVDNIFLVKCDHEKFSFSSDKKLSNIKNKIALCVERRTVYNGYKIMRILFEGYVGWTFESNLGSYFDAI